MVDTARKDRLAYTRSRIGQLYGPLCGLLGVEASVWVAINDEEDREPNLERFMTRVDTSIVPLNGRIEDTAFMSELSITDQEIRRELKTLRVPLATWRNKKPRRGARRVAIRPLRMFVRLARRKNTSVDNQKRLWMLTFFTARIIMSNG